MSNIDLFSILFEPHTKWFLDWGSTCLYTLKIYIHIVLLRPSLSGGTGRPMTQSQAHFTSGIKNKEPRSIAPFLTKRGWFLGFASCITLSVEQALCAHGCTIFDNLAYSNIYTYWCTLIVHCYTHTPRDSFLEIRRTLFHWRYMLLWSTCTKLRRLEPYNTGTLHSRSFISLLSHTELQQYCAESS